MATKNQKKSTPTKGADPKLIQPAGADRVGASERGRGKEKSSQTKKPPRSKPERPSGLDAAARVLAQAREPMRCSDLVKRMLDNGLWKTSGKTPAATINAAMLREIRDKGKESRFRKAGRGLFAARG